MIKVAKFGGSSVSDAAQFKKVRDIVRADKDRRYVVVSASGKRFADDNKITDLLLLVNAHINYHVDCTQLLKDIEERFVQTANELGLKYPIDEKFEEFASVIKSLSPEYIVSRGEWFTARLMAEYLGLPFLDTADVIVFH
ncbi:MAG: aspartate kinase, partial [Atopobiaceae bacterium]|nr:aspartate kinase [Atopobiaceae bacterium]